MHHNIKIVLIPLIASISFVFSFWLTSVRASQTMFGISADLAGGLALGVGLGLMLMLIRNIGKGRRTSVH